MHSRSIIATALAAVFLFTAIGCATSGGSSSGWVVVGKSPSSPPPAQKKTSPPSGKKNNKGQETASRNHIQSAYRFLQKGKPDHAMKELEKARSKMGKSFWFHYYMGGAFFMKAMYQQSDENWNIAYSYTRDSRLRSRVRTCQSFSINYLKGDDHSITFLRLAVDMDRDNHQARELLEDLMNSGTSSGPQVGFKGSSKSQGKKGRGKGEREKGKKPKKIKDKERFNAYFLVEME